MLCMSFSPCRNRYLSRKGDYFNRPRQAGLRSFVVPLLDFVDALSMKCDVYVIGSYEPLYEESYVQQVLITYVASGKGLIIVGPDVMPSIFYVPDAPPERSRRLGAETDNWNNHLVAGTTGLMAQARLVMGARGHDHQQWHIVANPEVMGTSVDRRSLQLSSSAIASTLPVRSYLCTQCALWQPDR